jgi:hypothetical protein
LQPFNDAFCQSDFCMRPPTPSPAKLSLDTVESLEISGALFAYDDRVCVGAKTRVAPPTFIHFALHGEWEIAGAGTDQK